MQRVRSIRAVVIATALLLSGGVCFADVVASFNEGAAPDASFYGFDHNYVGWAYTPAANFTITGVRTMFHPDIDSQNLTITCELYDGVGGTLIDSFNFQTGTVDGNGYAGGSFPLQHAMTGGHEYFVGLVGVGQDGLGVNYSSNGPDILPFYFGQFSYSENGPLSEQSEALPVLKIEGIVPEPTSAAIFVAGGSLACVKRRRTR